MIQVNDLVVFECPNCGYLAKGRSGKKMSCPKCDPDFKGYSLDGVNQHDSNESKDSTTVRA